MLTLVSSFGLIFTLLDYLGPKSLEKLFSSDQWTGDKEKRLDKICKSVVDICLLLTSILNYYLELKKTTSSLLLVSAYVWLCHFVYDTIIGKWLKVSFVLKKLY